MKKSFVIGLIFLLSISFISAFSWSDLLPSGKAISSSSLDSDCISNCLNEKCSEFKTQLRQQTCLNSELRKKECEEKCVGEEKSKGGVFVKTEEKVKVSGGNFEVVDKEGFVEGPDQEFAGSPYAINFGTMNNFYKLENYQEEIQKGINELNYLEIKWVRINIEWAIVEDVEDTLDYSVMDDYVNALQENNINFILSFMRVPNWACDYEEVDYGEGWLQYDESYGDWIDQDLGACNRPLFNVDDWYNFVYETTNRYKDKTKYFMLPAELDVDGHFEGTAKQYREMFLKPGARAIKDACPNCKVIGPTTAGTDTFWWLEDEEDFAMDKSWLRTVLENGGWESLDIISFNEYGGGADYTYEERANRVVDKSNELYNEVIKDFGNKPLWITETGSPHINSSPWGAQDCSEQTQKKFYNKLIKKEK